MVIRIKGDTLTTKDLGRSNLTWATELKSAVSNARSDQHVYLVATVIPSEGIYNFVQDLRSVKEFSGVRFVKVIDLVNLVNLLIQIF